MSVFYYNHLGENSAAAMNLFPYEMSLLSSVDNVMSDRPALEAFIDWIRLDPLRIGDSVDLYFALKSFRELREQNKQETAKLACQLHRKYISLRTGSCSFLAEPVRQTMSDRIHSLPKDVKLIPKDLFNVVEDPLMKMLTEWHADFVLSEQFSKISFSDSPSPSASDIPFGDDMPVNCADSEDDIFDLNESPKPPKKDSRNHSAIQVGVASTSAEQAPPLQDEDEVINFRRETGSEESETGSSGFGIDSRLRTDCSSLLDEEKKARDQMDVAHRTADSHPHRHDKPETRFAFAAELGGKLQAIAERRAVGQDTFARDLPPRDTSFSSRSDRSAIRTGRGGDIFDAGDPDEGDFMVDKYVEKMEAKMNKKNRSHSKRRDQSTPNTFMNPIWGNSSGQYPGQDFGLVIGMQSASLMNNGYRTYNTLQYPSYKRQGSAFTGSSGFCSGESTFYGDRSYDSHRAPYNNSSASFGSGYSSTLSRRQPQGFAPPPQQNIFATLPRRPVADSTIVRSKCILRCEGEAAPYVAHLTGTNIRLGEFRQTFGVSRRDNLRLFFKSPCEDASAPYQWTIITDDEHILPVFEEKIEAEARIFMD